MNDFVKPKDQREFIRFGLARNRTFKNDFVKPNEQSSSLLEYSAMARKRLLKTNLWHEKIFCKFTGFSNDNHNKQQKSLHPEGIGKKSRGKKQKSEEQNRLLFCSSLF